MKYLNVIASIIESYTNYMCGCGCGKKLEEKKAWNSEKQRISFVILRSFLFIFLCDFNTFLKKKPRTKKKSCVHYFQCVSVKRSGMWYVLFS